ncbi:MAG: hypothetical protein GVY32_03945 [Gammaproteobacteria bacterium]|jgi:hypothetical protein|nr:hypothetical protein [Gammaproteobacteria bacterium]
MSEPGAKPRSTTIELVVWCIAAPILSVWALLSMLPVVSLIRAWGDPGQSLIALAFLATGALGLVGGAVVYRWLRWDQAAAPVVSSETRTIRAVALSAYALVWMALYAL